MVNLYKNSAAPAHTSPKSYKIDNKRTPKARVYKTENTLDHLTVLFQRA